MDEMLFEVRDHVAVMTFNRPNKLNAVDGPTVALLRNSLQKINEDPEIHCAILTGAGGKAFCAGADIVMESTKDVIGAYKMSRGGSEITDMMEHLRVPVIAAINGFALGGGLEFALGCDLRIASENAVIGVPEVNLGLIPGGGGTQRLARLIGSAKAAEMLYTGKNVKAREALTLGIVSKVVPSESLMDEAMALANTIASKPPFAVEYIKIVLRDGMECDLQRGLQIESALYAHLFCTQDAQDAFKAFIEKRQKKE